jgi:Bacterial EndoU nuclease
VANNYLKHEEQIDRFKADRACHGGDASACGRRDALDALSRKRQDDLTDKCRGGNAADCRQINEQVWTDYAGLTFYGAELDKAIAENKDPATAKYLNELRNQNRTNTAEASVVLKINLGELKDNKGGATYGEQSLLASLNTLGNSEGISAVFGGGGAAPKNTGKRPGANTAAEEPRPVVVDSKNDPNVTVIDTNGKALRFNPATGVYENVPPQQQLAGPAPRLALSGPDEQSAALQGGKPPATNALTAPPVKPDAPSKPPSSDEQAKLPPPVVSTQGQTIRANVAESEAARAASRFDDPVTGLPQREAAIADGAGGVPPAAPNPLIDWKHAGADVRQLPNGSWRATGGHDLNDPNLRIAPGTTPVENPNGTLTAQVEMRLPNGTWVPKSNNGGEATVLPRDWDPDKINAEVNAAFSSGFNPASNTKFFATSPSGVRFQFVYDPNLKIWRFSPTNN